MMRPPGFAVFRSRARLPVIPSAANYLPLLGKGDRLRWMRRFTLFRCCPPTDPNAMIRQSLIIKPLPFASRPINLQS